MISCSSNISGRRSPYVFFGLSTDSKPITYESLAVINGSVFIEIDTSDYYIYDEENQTWYKM